MNPLYNTIARLKTFAESELAAADETFLGNDDLTRDIRDSQLDYDQLVIARANALLDRNRDQVFISTLNISNRADAERAYRAYDFVYLMALPLSLEALSDLAKELMTVCASYKVPAAAAWVQIARFDVLHSEADQDKEEYYPRKLAEL